MVTRSQSQKVIIKGCFVQLAVAEVRPTF